MALPFFGKKEERSLGVDIGTSGVKIVELEGGDAGKVALTNYGEVSLSPDAAVQARGMKLSSQKAEDMVKEIIKEARFESRNAVVSIPAFSGFSTVISMPRMTSGELEKAVSFEAKKHIPLPLAEVRFEWIELGEGIRGAQNAQSEKQTQVLIVAVTNELINKYSQIAKLSGLKLAHLELDNFSLPRALDSEGIQLFIDMGARNTSLTISQDGWPMISRTVEAAGYEFTRLLSTSLGIDFLRAEELKKKQGIDAAPQVLLPLVDSILAEGRRMIEEYESKRNARVSKIALSGGAAGLGGLLEYAAKSTEKETVVAFPFHGIMYPSELEPALREIGPAFSVAVGSALREFKD